MLALILSYASYGRTRATPCTSTLAFRTAHICICCDYIRLFRMQCVLLYAVRAGQSLGLRCQLLAFRSLTFVRLLRIFYYTQHTHTRTNTRSHNVTISACPQSKRIAHTHRTRKISHNNILHPCDNYVCVCVSLAKSEGGRRLTAQSRIGFTSRPSCLAQSFEPLSVWFCRVLVDGHV